MSEPIATTKRSEALRAELEEFRATAEQQAQARMEALRQALMTEIQVRIEMYERMIAEVEALEGAGGGNDPGGRSGDLPQTTEVRHG